VRNQTFPTVFEPRLSQRVFVARLGPRRQSGVNQKGQADFMPWRNITAPVAYVPVAVWEFPGLIQQWESELAPVGIEDASVGLVSRTYAQKGATANRTLGIR
jgi:hypothetical protein